MDDGARVFTDGDIAALRSWDALIASGAIAAADELPHVRAIGQTMSRLADWQVRELMARITEVEGTDEMARAAAAAAVTAEMLPVVESLMSYTWRRHLAAAVGRILATLGRRAVHGHRGDRVRRHRRVHEHRQAHRRR